MGAAAKYDPPHVQLRRLAVAARLDGMPFEAFWQRAIREGEPLVKTTTADPPEGAVLWPSDYHDRQEWWRAIRSQKEDWRRAYERAPSEPREDALVYLAGEGLLGADEPAVGIAA